MARINLLPWRQAERERKNREFLTLLAGVLLLSLLAAFAAWSYFNDTLDSQRQANEKIKAENTNLDKALAEIDTLEKQRDEMISRMKVIQDLQGRRPIPVRVWDDIARLIPPQMYLINMKRDGDVITFRGKADNPDVVATFIRNLDGSEWLENSAMKSIQQPQATAYQTAPTAPAASPATPAGGTAPPRPTYPEDSYVSFEVTTMLAKGQDMASATAGTTVKASSSTGGTAISSTNQTAVANTMATATSVPSATHTATSTPAPSQNTQAAAPITNGKASSTVATTTTATTTTVTKETK